MKKIKKSVDNPHGLTNKQKLVVADVGRKVEKNRPMDVVGSTEKIYSVTSKRSASTISSRNMTDPDFRQALLDELEDRQILGPNSVVNTKVVEGLDAEGKDGPDYPTRLKYIQEIHKVAGVYAPMKIEKKSLTLSADISEKDLDDRIKELTEELGS